MKPQMFQGVNCIPGENQPEYVGLPVMAELRDGVPHMTTLWRPTPEELALLNAGGLVCLTLQVWQHPPVVMFAQGFDGTIPDDIGAD
jgi:hypothetical protein